MPALAIAALLALAYWLIKTRPFKICRRCHGIGQLNRRFAAPKPCRACKGTGLSTRAARRKAKTTRRTFPSR